VTVVTHTYRFSGLGEDFGPRKGSGLVILHTTEGDGSKVTVADALALAKWQDADDVAGSYNRLIAVDGVVSTVPDDHAAGGVNPFSPYFKPVPWLYQMLPAAKVNDPNAYALQLSFMGRRATHDANGWPPSMIDYAARSIIEEEQRIGGPVVVANHSEFQPGNRTDAGPIATDLVMKRYAELSKPSVVDDMPQLTTYALERITLDYNANIRNAPTATDSFEFRTATTGERSTAIRVGTVVNAEDTWSVWYHEGRRKWLYTVAQNVVKVEPIPQTVEVIKEVPGDCSAAIAAAVDPLTERIRRGKEAAVQIGAVAKALETVLG
jgi:hypothetical protein